MTSDKGEGCVGLGVGVGKLYEAQGASQPAKQGTDAGRESRVERAGQHEGQA